MLEFYLSRVDENTWNRIYIQNRLFEVDPFQQNRIIKDLDREIFGDD